MVGDRISNLIISIKNASMAGKDTVSLQKTKMVSAILEVLKEKKYILDAVENNGNLDITLIYDEKGNSAITDVKRVSKQSKRVYKQAKEINSVKNGYGLAVITTPKGVISDDTARKENVGGEVLFEIW